MARIYFHTSVDELEALVREHGSNAAVLGPIWEELTFRSTDRSRQLLREVRALLDGQIPQPPAPPRPDSPDDQTTLF
jgi:hypothetical protein